MHNGKYQCIRAASCTHHLPAIISSLFSNSHTKSLTLNENNYLSFLLKTKTKQKRLENGPLAHTHKNYKTKRARGLDRETREETGRRNQTTATQEARHRTSPAFLNNNNNNNVHLSCAQKRPERSHDTY